MMPAAGTRYRNRQYQLVSYPDGMVCEENFALVDAPLRDLGPNEVLLAVRYISVDPAMRLYMDPASMIGGNADLTAMFVRIGDVIRAWVLGEVVASNCLAFPVGSYARDIGGGGGIQEYTIVDGSDLLAVDPEEIPLQAHIGVLGMPGLTAYRGMVDVARPVAGETVVISAAAGGVGGIAGQIAKVSGCRVIGIAGGAKKCAYVTDDLKFDACIDYKGTDVAGALAKHCPDGIDIFFDNVGGPILDACLARLASGARIASCGAVAIYNGGDVALHNWPNILVRQARWEAFSYYGMIKDPVACRHALGEITRWITAGSVKHVEHVFDGIESFVPALRAMYSGDTIGKVMLRLPIQENRTR